MANITHDAIVKEQIAERIIKYYANVSALAMLIYDIGETFC